MSNSLKAILINLVLFIFLIILYFLSGFLEGYGSNNNYEAAYWRLYIIFIIAHFILSFLILNKLKITNTFSIVLSCIEILILYGVIGWIYR